LVRLDGWRHQIFRIGDPTIAVLEDALRARGSDVVVGTWGKTRWAVAWREPLDRDVLTELLASAFPVIRERAFAMLHELTLTPPPSPRTEPRSRSRRSTRD